MENVNKISYNINSGSGSLAKLMNDDNLYDNLEKSTSELASLIEDIKNNPKRYVNFSILGGNKKSYDKNKLK
jgi:phospholipid/cholesterol/gamma-HCH transport system substrate-binding protein